MIRWWNSIIEVDEAVMAKYPQGTQPSAAELNKLIVRAVTEGTPVPIVCSAARLISASTKSLDAAIPLRRLDPQDHGLKDGQEADEDRPERPAVARVFKPHRSVREAELHSALLGAHQEG